MATKLVTYYTDGCKLPCACKGTVPVIMCTKYDASVPGTLQDTEDDTCSKGRYKHTISYDSEDLPEGVTALATTDIVSVVCEGCLTDWIREKFSHYTVSEREAGYTEDLSDADNLEEFAGITLSITNPSLKQDLVGMVHYNFRCSFAILGPYAMGVQAGLYIDGVAQDDTTKAVYAAVSDAGEGTSVFQAEASCVFPLTIPPGETVDLNVRFLALIDSPVGDGSLAIDRGQLAFHGSTTMG